MSPWNSPSDMDIVLAFFVKTTAEIQAKEASFRALFCTSPMLHLLPFNKGLGTGFCVDAPVSHKGHKKQSKEKIPPYTTTTRLICKSCQLSWHQRPGQLQHNPPTNTFQSSLQGKLEEKFWVIWPPDESLNYSLRKFQWLSTIHYLSTSNMLSQHNITLSKQHYLKLFNFTYQLQMQTFQMR